MLKWVCLFLIWRKVLEKFNKESLTAEEQLRLLMSRNLKVNDFNSAVKIIEYLGFTSDAKFVRFSNWLYALSVVRNICAHHSRLFNRIFRISPSKHDKIEEFREAENNRFYYIAMIINYYLVTMAQDNSYEEDLQTLFNRYESVDKTKMGFPPKWSAFSISRCSKSFQYK